jgi:hypothetical protein
MRKWSITAGAFALTLAAAAGVSLADSNRDTIKGVMKAAMKGGLCKSVATGKATPAQRAELLKLFQDLARAQPPRGDASDWQTKTTALVNAAQAAVDGKSGASAQLNAAANCKACHAAHKGQ